MLMPLTTHRSYPKHLYCWNACCHCSAAATTAITPALTSYVIESYRASSKHNVFAMYSKGTNSTFYYPYGVILPCLKLSLIIKLNLRLANLEEVRKVRNFPQCHCHFASQVCICGYIKLKLHKS